jgi:transcriptional regulator with GAF, ATPase, and Fis domain/tetratricopeptide (TPR) repeat protein
VKPLVAIFPSGGASASVDVEGPSAFAVLDDVVADAQTFGCVRVHAQPGAMAALARHVERRGLQASRGVTLVLGAGDPWPELARRFEALEGGTTDARDVADALTRRLAGMLVVVSEGAPTTWGRAVAAELVRRAGDRELGLLLVVLADASGASDAGRVRELYDDEARDSDAGPSTARTSFVSAAEPRSHATIVDSAPRSFSERAVTLELHLGGLSRVEQRRWWSAVVEQDAFALSERFGDIASLDGWWQATRARGTEDAEQHLVLGDDALTLLSYAAEAGQALAPDAMKRLELEREAATLFALGLARLEPNGALSCSEPRATRELSPAERTRLAGILATSDADAWALVRAAELSALAGRAAEAEALALRALKHAADAAARHDLWQRLETMMAGLDQRAGGSGDEALARALRSAEYALELGDGARACRFAQQALAIDPARFDALLLHGRSNAERGDVTTAALSLSRAMGAAENDAERAEAAGVLAHVRYVAGDPQQAELYARQAIDLATTVTTRLAGRNVIGKLLLAREAWAEADEHFACDAYEAAIAGLREDELRARLNRSIAVMYLGRRERSREMLVEVLRDGERANVSRAVAFALSNLAAIATLEHDYEQALDLSERAIEIRRRVEGRLGMVQPITNLAELRVRLGLVDEAEQLLRFGLHECGPDLPLSRYAFFAKASAYAHLERGETALAARDVAAAFRGALCAGDKGVLEQCHRIAARIALEDGDVQRARTAIAQASTFRPSPYGRAEVALIEAMCARASGEPFVDLGREALMCAEQADDPETLREAHLLLHHGYVQIGDDAAARSHLDGAFAARDRVAGALRGSLRARYLARRSIAELGLLEGRRSAWEAAAPRSLRTLLASGELSGCDLDGRSSARPVGDEAPVTRRSAARERQIVGESAAVRALVAAIARVAATEATVLVNGETGTGKELVAEALHRASPRARGPLVKVNCAALVETLLLSELFGHERGAFTGASARRRGRFEVAEGGTLFLDEIGDISPRTQVALLRVLQDGSFERVGGTTSLKANVRIVCATHRDLRALVQRGEFREDLYYRLCGVVLEVPALRDRVVDIPLLAPALLEQASRATGIEPKPLSSEALRALSRHSWPGNVRELENALRVAALFARGPTLTVDDFSNNVEGLRGIGNLVASVSSSGLPPPLDGPPSLDPRSLDPGRSLESLRAGESLGPPSDSTDLVYAEVRAGMRLSDMKRRLEHECIARALVESGGNITRAAELLGMKRPRLSQLVKQYKLANVVEDMKP